MCMRSQIAYGQSHIMYNQKQIMSEHRQIQYDQGDISCLIEKTLKSKKSHEFSLIDDTCIISIDKMYDCSLNAHVISLTFYSIEYTIRL